jgi:serine/threonine-protein kinase
LYYCLTGQVPFPGANYTKKVMAHQFNPVTPIRDLAPHVPAKLAAIVERMMGKTPEERFPNMQEVAESLRALIARPGQVGSTPDMADPVGSTPSSVARNSKTMPAAEKPMGGASGTRPAIDKGSKPVVAKTEPTSTPAPKAKSSMATLIVGSLVGVAVVAAAVYFVLMAMG